MNTIIKNVLHSTYGRVNVMLEGDKIKTISSDDVLNLEQDYDYIDGENYVMFPSFVDGHAHIDKTVYGLDWFCNDVGYERIDRIVNERNQRAKINFNYFEQASRYIELSLKFGVLHMRSHVDIDTQHKLKGLGQVLEAREKYKDLFDLQIVAFPQSGLMVRPGTYELMDEALSMGADVVGGIDPAWIDRDPKGSIDAIFKLAEKHNKPIDIHIHEAAELGAFDLELIIEKTVAMGMQGRVSISHAFCLGMPNQKVTQVLKEKIKEANINIINCYQAYLPAVPPLKELMDMGINIAGGNDDMRDMWTPYGTGDILERMQLISMKNGFRKDSDLELSMTACTYNGSKVFGLENYGIVEGNTANFVLVKGRTISECIVTCPDDRIVFRNGKVISRNGVNMF